MMTPQQWAQYDRIRKVVDLIRYRDWAFNITFSSGQFYLEVSFDDGNSEASGRQWLIRSDMRPNEIAQTALKAVLTAEEHEARKQFLVDGEAIYTPNWSLDDLIQFARERRVIAGRASAAEELTTAE